MEMLSPLDGKFALHNAGPVLSAPHLQSLGELQMHCEKAAGPIYREP